jgi:hypothetical protein
MQLTNQIQAVLARQVSVNQEHIRQVLKQLLT